MLSIGAKLAREEKKRKKGSKERRKKVQWLKMKTHTELAE